MADDDHTDANAADPVPSETGTGGSTQQFDRRVFLNTSWKVLGVALLVEAAWTSYDILNPQPSGAFGGVVDAGKVNDYAADGSVKYFEDGRFFVSSSSGQLVALYQKCPHLGCKVPFNDQTHRFECPCHGSVYNVRGEYIEGPAPRGMDRFLLKVEGDQVLVDTGNVVEGPPRGVDTLSGGAESAPHRHGSDGADQADGATS